MGSVVSAMMGSVVSGIGVGDEGTVGIVEASVS